MLTQYALIFSIALHFGAAIIVISLIRATKYNSSWILLSIALFVMALTLIATGAICGKMKAVVQEPFHKLNRKF